MARNRKLLASYGIAIMALTASACIVRPEDPGPATVRFTVDALAERQPISPLIYGSNTARDVETNGLTLVRLGHSVDEQRPALRARLVDIVAQFPRD